MDFIITAFSSKGSFWANAVPFTAALAVLPLVTGAATSAEQCGAALRAGLASQAALNGFSTDFLQTVRGVHALEYAYKRFVAVCI